MSMWWFLPTLVLIGGAGFALHTARRLESEARRLRATAVLVSDTARRRDLLLGATSDTRVRLDRTAESVARRHPR